MKKIIFTLLVLLSFSAANANLRLDEPIYDFMEGGIAYDIIDSTAKTVEVTYKAMPLIPTGSSKLQSPVKFKAQANEADTTITIPSKVTHNGITYDVIRIGAYAFYNFSYSQFAIDSKPLNIILPSSVKTIEEWAFSNNRLLKSVSMPDDGVTTLKKCAFAECYMSEIVLPKSLVIIGPNAFYRCFNITSIMIPDAVKFVDCYAFTECGNLYTLRLDASLDSIGNCAFAGCPTLSYIYCDIVVPLKVNSNVFDSVNKSKCSLYVPKGSGDAYKAAPVWKDFYVLDGPDGVNNVNSAKTVAGVKYVNAAGIQSSKPFEGINVVVTTYTDGTTSVVKQIKK
jgi:hypothetical protein